MKWPAFDMQVACDQAFHRWCADEMVDMRMVDVLEDAFAAGFQSRAAMEGAFIDELQRREDEVTALRQQIEHAVQIRNTAAQIRKAAT